MPSLTPFSPLLLNTRVPTVMAGAVRGGSRRKTTAQKPALAVRLKRAVTQALVLVGSLLSWRAPGRVRCIWWGCRLSALP